MSNNFLLGYIFGKQDVTNEVKEIREKKEKWKAKIKIFKRSLESAKLLVATKMFASFNLSRIVLADFNDPDPRFRYLYLWKNKYSFMRPKYL